MDGQPRKSSSRIEVLASISIIESHPAYNLPLSATDCNGQAGLHCLAGGFPSVLCDALPRISQALRLYLRTFTMPRFICKPAEDM